LTVSPAINGSFAQHSESANIFPQPPSLASDAD
jgi:hypothetical protein